MCNKQFLILMSRSISEEEQKTWVWRRDLYSNLLLLEQSPTFTWPKNKTMCQCCTYFVERQHVKIIKYLVWQIITVFYAYWWAGSYFLANSSKNLVASIAFWSNKQCYLHMIKHLIQYLPCHTVMLLVYSDVVAGLAGCIATAFQGNRHALQVAIRSQG